MEGLGHLFCSHSHPDGGFLRCLRDSERAGWPCGPVRANLAQYWHGLDDLLCYAVALEDALTGAGIHAPFCMILHATELPWCTQLCAKRANWKRSSGTTGCVSQTRLLNNMLVRGRDIIGLDARTETMRGSLQPHLSSSVACALQWKTIQVVRNKCRKRIHAERSRRQAGKIEQVLARHVHR